MAKIYSQSNTKAKGSHHHNSMAQQFLITLSDKHRIDTNNHIQLSHSKHYTYRPICDLSNSCMTFRDCSSALPFMSTKVSDLKRVFSNWVLDLCRDRDTTGPSSAVRGIKICKFEILLIGGKLEDEVTFPFLSLKENFWPENF